jgi:hypothetical protein
MEVIRSTSGLVVVIDYIHAVLDSHVFD